MKFSNTRDLIVGARLLAIGLVGLAGSAFAQKATPLPGAVQKPELKLKAPAGFMENKGQWDADALFFHRSAGQDFWVTKTGYVVDVHRFASTTRPGGHEGLAQGTEGQIMKVTFLGVSGNVTTLGTSPSKMKMDFVPIHNPELSTTGVKTYAEASVNQLYPGISAKYYLDSGMPRYDLVLDPGANPNTIRFSIDGAERSYIDKDGSLVMQSRIGDVKQTGLYAYQMINGKKVEVEASFKSIGSEGFGFRVGKFDSSKSLILDPVVYGTFMGGGAGADEVKGITSDATGRVYVSGTTSAIDFPITVGPYGPNLTTASDGYMAVIDGDAYDQVYGAFIVGAGNADNCSFLKLDQYGNLWLSGDTNSNSFPGGAGTRTQVGFFLRFETSPTAILDPLTRPMSGIIGSAATATAITGFGILPRSTATGNVDLVWTGNTTGTVIGLGAPPAGMNGFLVRRSMTPSPLSMSAVQATSAYIGSTTADRCTGLAIGADRGIYVVGTVGTNNVNVLLTTTSPVFAISNPTFPNGATLRMVDCYLRKYNDNGTVAYSGVFGSSVNDIFPGAGNTGIDVINANLPDPLYYLNSPQVAVDQLGSAYVTGIAGGFNFPKTRDAFIQTFGGGEIFVTKFNPSGTQIVYSTSLGSSRAAPTGISVDFRGNAYVGGVVTWDLPPILPGTTIPGSIITTAGNANGQEAAADATYTGGNRTFPPPLGALISGQDGFLTVLNNTATDLNYSSYIGGDLDEAVSGLYIDTTQSVWLAGYATSLPAAWLTPNAFKTATQPIGPPFGSDQDGLILKYRYGLPVLGQLVLSTNEIPGGLGANVTGVVTLRAPAPIGGTIVTLRVSNPAIARFNSQGGPSTIRVTIPQGANFANFTVFSNRVLEPTFTDIRAEYDSDLLVTRLNVRPWLNSFQISSAAINGGNTIQGVVTLFAPAPAGGVNVGLSSDNPALVEFPSPIINIPAGQQSLAFTMVTHGVGTPTVVQITATVEGVGQTQVLTLNPATVLDVSVAPTTINGGETSTGIVRLDGEAVAGVQVTLSQTGLHVSIPTFVNFNAGDVQGTFTIMAPPVTAADQTTTITGTLGVSAAATTLVIESNNISAMNLTSTNVLGGTVIDGSITLVRPAAASGFTIPFATDSPALVQFVPTSVTIPPGATSATFQIRTVGMSTTQNATVSCDKDGYNRAIRVITVRALEFGISFAPSTVKGGSPVVATVTLGNGDVAPFGGITMQVSSSAPLTANGPTSITIPAGAGSVTFGITTTVIANDANVVFTAGTVGGVQRTGTLLVKGIALSALSISPTSVLGGISATGTLTLDQNAPTGGFTVNLASSNPGIATVPATVTVPAGQKVVSFVVSTLAVATSQNITITATRGTFVQSASLSVNPSSVQSITFNPATVLGLQSTTATVTLNALAPAGGLTVSLAANRPEFVGFPSSVVVPAGTNSVTFTVTTTQVTRSVGVIFTATSIGNVTATGTLFIDPSTD